MDHSHPQTRYWTHLTSLLHTCPGHHACGVSYAAYVTAKHLCGTCEESRSGIWGFEPGCRSRREGPSKRKRGVVKSGFWSRIGGFERSSRLIWIRCWNANCLGRRRTESRQWCNGLPRRDGGWLGVWFSCWIGCLNYFEWGLQFERRGKVVVLRRDSLRIEHRLVR